MLGVIPEGSTDYFLLSAPVSKWTSNAWVWQSNNVDRLLSPLKKYSITPVLSRRYKYLQLKVMASVRLEGGGKK